MNQEILDDFEEKGSAPESEGRLPIYAFLLYFMNALAHAIYVEENWLIIPLRFLLYILAPTSISAILIIIFLSLSKIFGKVIGRDFSFSDKFWNSLLLILTAISTIVWFLFDIYSL